MAYNTVRKVFGGCFTCGGEEAMWETANAHGVAARHHKKTGHPTWVNVTMSIKYWGEGTRGRKVEAA